MVVGVLQGPGRVRGDPERDLHGELRLAPESVAETLPFDEGHGEPELPGSVPGVVHREDMGMLEAGDRFDLALEALGAERLGQLRMKHLEGDEPLVPEVDREEDRGHAASPELTLNAVAISQAALEPVARICHSRPVVTVIWGVRQKHMAGPAGRVGRIPDL